MDFSPERLDKLRERMEKELKPSATSVRQLIFSLAPVIEKKVAEKVKTKDICEWLSAEGISISPDVLRVYMSEYRKSRLPKEERASVGTPPVETSRPFARSGKTGGGGFVPPVSPSEL